MPAPTGGVPDYPLAGLAGIEHAASFKTAMRRHAAGVCIISTGIGDEVNGMAVTAATSFSTDPPAVLVCVNRSASISAQLSPGSRFRLTLLGTPNALVAQAFSRKPGGKARFDTGTWRLEACELPLLEDSPANISCRIEHVFAYGSHAALLGLVTDVRLGPDMAGLVYRDGAYA